MVDILKNMEETQILEQAKEHVRNNLIPAIQTQEGCVDGRDENSEGAISRPGADAGYVQVLLALKNEGKVNLSARECVDVVKEAVKKLGRKFSFHTDSHSPQEVTDPRIGCGHLANPTDPEKSGAYGVAAEDMQKAIVYMKELAENGEANLVNLLGEHEEIGVLVVTGTKNTVKHYGPKSMYFVYDRARDSEAINQLVPELNIPGLTTEDFNDIAERQTMATLHNLAPGKPIFEVNADIPEPAVKFVGNVA